MSVCNAECSWKTLWLKSHCQIWSALVSAWYIEIDLMVLPPHSSYCAPYQMNTLWVWSNQSFCWWRGERRIPFQAPKLLYWSSRDLHGQPIEMGVVMMGTARDSKVRWVQPHAFGYIFLYLYTKMHCSPRSRFCDSHFLHTKQASSYAHKNTIQLWCSL